MDDALPIWKRPRARLYALVALLWLVGLGVVAVAWKVLLPFLLAALAAYVLDPVIVAIGRRRLAGRALPRWAAVLLVYAFLGGGLYFTAVSVVPQVYKEAVRGLTQARDFLAGLTPDRIDEYAATVDAFLKRYGIPLDVVPDQEGEGSRVTVDLAGAFAAALSNLSGTLTARLGDVLGLTQALVAGAVRALFFVVLLLMLTFFISVDAPRVVGFGETMLPRLWRGDYRSIVHGIDAGLAGVVRGQLTIMLINGTLTLAGLLLLRIPFAFALAALATVLYVVPIFGTILSSIPIVLLALTQGVSKGLLALAWILGIHALESYFLNPKIMGDASRIHPVLIVLALVAGEHWYGIAGALLAVPVASVVVAVFKFLHRRAVEMDEQLARAAAAPLVPPPAA